ncbi:MAG: hypothetical protein NTZ51_07110 [Proteobacteria bacterium]|nr:hypothetical protein [Pseudomonadota bacterium]
MRDSDDEIMDTSMWPQKAYKNQEFLTSPDARPIRILCEFLEPGARFRHLHVRNTIVFFGSTKILSRTVAETKLQEIESTFPEEELLLPDIEYLHKKACQDLIMSRYYEDAAALSEKLTRWSLSIEDKTKRFYICSGNICPLFYMALNTGMR